MARGTVTGLTRLRYHDTDGRLRSTPCGQEVDIPRQKEYEHAVQNGWIEPLAGEEPTFAESSASASPPTLRREPPRDWRRRPSLWFITPCWRRYELTRICLEERLWVCGELADMGIDASCVVIADDENLDSASELGFALHEFPNNGLGARFNAGISYAAAMGVDYVCMIGSDTWVLPSYFEQLPERGTVRASRRLAITSKDGKRLHRLGLTYPGGACRTYPVEMFADFNYRPATPEIMKGCDGSILRKAKSLGEVTIDYAETDELQLVGLRSNVQVSDDDLLIERFGLSESGRPWAQLKLRYPAALVDRAREFYVSERRKVAV
jgi:hypothetical protein